ncbi:MAG: hypothetical protein RLY31_561 [Bacteroidota bacterium]|jgi:triosephosphate isomerase
MTRKKIVAGNWKMNKSLPEGEALAREVLAGMPSDSSALAVLCPPFLHLSSLSGLLAGRDGIALGAQNCHSEPNGAYTGEIAAPMLRSVGVEYVILGHSERRAYFGETEAWLAAKVNAVLSNGMVPIYCCGELLEAREAGKQESVVSDQVSGGLFHLSDEAMRGVVIAYEPVWAIGTGRTASPQQAQDMHRFIRNLLADRYGAAVAEQVPILYGGSCKPDNAEELFSQPDVDGGLIGGASLKAADFLGILAKA